MNKRLLFFTVLLVLAASVVQAQIQKGNALFEHLTIEDGLSTNNVNCLFQDSRGFLWIGTANGLNRYDGVDILQYFKKDGTNSIAGNHITSIREDKQKNLWIGTNEGVSYFEPLKNKFTNYLHTSAEFKTIKASQYYVALDSDDNLWVTSNFHLSFFDKEKKQFIHYKIDNGEFLNITRNYNVRSAFEDSKKRLWIPTSYGVKQFNRNTKQFISFHFAEKDKAMPENFVVVIKETQSHKIIASTWGGGLLVFNEAAGRFDKCMLYEEPMPIRNLINIILDILPVNNKIYCATSEGLVVVDEADVSAGVCKQFARYTYYENDSRGINSKFCNHLLMDKTGTLWIAAKGVNKIDPLKQQFKNTFLTHNKQKLSISGVATYNDSLLLGANDGYLFLSNSLLPLGLNSKMKSNFGEQVWDVYTGKNFCWLATTNGLIQTTREGKFVKQFIHQKDNPSTIAGERIWKVYEDSRGLVWLGSVRRGISILNPDDGSIKNYFSVPGEKNSLFNCYINDFFEDRAGNIWFTSKEDQLYCYNRAAQEFSVKKIGLSNGENLVGTPHIIQMQADGSFILASLKGILRFQPSTQKAEVIATHSDLSAIKHATATKDGNYWMITGNGLLQYNTSIKTFKRYTTQNGLPTNEDIDVIKQLPDGTILLAGLGFISFFNPLELGNNKNIPPVCITQVLANSKDTLFENKVYELPYLSGMSFQFSALNFSNARQNLYKYRLTGIDKEWSQPTYQRSVSYAQLPPGTYTFEVMGSNADGMWNEQPAVFSFSIKRPFYKTWWFYTLLVLTAGGVLYTLYRYRLEKAIELEKMRTRIATDLHDDIGATLSSISMYSDALKKQVKDTMPQLEPILTKMGNSSREMVTGMSDIVWAINPDNDSGEKLIQRMESYATDICAVKNIRLVFDADEGLRQLELPLEKRKNIYLVFKEAVNNAVKYSEAKNIQVRLRYDDTVLQLEVKDDGTGFDETTVRSGNGLKNLQLRAEEINGQLELISAAGSGTTVRLNCTV